MEMTGVFMADFGVKAHDRVDITIWTGSSNYNSEIEYILATFTSAFDEKAADLVLESSLDVVIVETIKEFPVFDILTQLYTCVRNLCKHGEIYLQRFVLGGIVPPTFQALTDYSKKCTPDMWSVAYCILSAYPEEAIPHISDAFRSVCVDVTESELHISPAGRVLGHLINPIFHSEDQTFITKSIDIVMETMDPKAEWTGLHWANQINPHYIAALTQTNYFFSLIERLDTTVPNKENKWRVVYLLKIFSLLFGCDKYLYTIRKAPIERIQQLTLNDIRKISSQAFETLKAFVRLGNKAVSQLSSHCLISKYNEVMDTLMYEHQYSIVELFLVMLENGTKGQRMAMLVMGVVESIFRIIDEVDVADQWKIGKSVCSFVVANDLSHEVLEPYLEQLEELSNSHNSNVSAIFKSILEEMRLFEEECLP